MKLALNFILIVLMSVFAAILYGIVHDQVTVRLCIEYFTVAHAPLFHSTNPTVLALFWGTAATWWMGLALGIGLAIACCCRKKKTPPKALIEPLSGLLIVMMLGAAISGVLGYLAYRQGILRLPEGLDKVIPAKRQGFFVVDWCAHWASYVFGFFGGLTVIYRAAKGKYAPSAEA